MNKFTRFFAAGLIVLLAIAPVSAWDLEDGSYEGTGSGYAGDILVEVVVEDGRLIEINVLDHSETPMISDAGFNTTIERVLEAQSLEVDTVSGATATSKGLLEALADALGLSKEE